jgi:hypothetical protein
MNTSLKHVLVFNYAIYSATLNVRDPQKYAFVANYV